MMAMTAISVVVARMIPSSVKKLRSLLPRRDPAATDRASPMDAFDLTDKKTVPGRILFRPTVLFLTDLKSVASRGPS
jgi:hypothetical protein